ncbi:MAG: hypothetical protein WB341_09980 [Terracidiphilus sp.]
MKEIHIRYLLFVVLILSFGPLAFGQECVTSVPLGICGPYDYPSVTGNNGNNVNVQNGFWNSANAPAGSSQTMYSTSPGNWYVEANFANGNTAVMSYPDSDAIYTDPLLGSYASIYSSFAKDMSLNSDTGAEAAYDIWLNDYGNEVMIWTDISNRSSAGCSGTLAQVSFGGSNGVPTHLWDLWKCSSGEIVWQLDQQAFGSGTPTVYGLSSGSVDIYAMLTWLMTNGYLPLGTTIKQIEYGFEIASTGGVNEQFQVTGWSVTDTAAAPGFIAGSGGTSSITVTHGSSGKGPVSVAGTGGFTGTVTLSCQVTTAMTNVNDAPGCSLNPPSVSISGTTAATSTLTVTTTAASNATNDLKRLFWPSAGGTALALVLLFGVPKRGRNWLTMTGLLLLVVSCAVMGCGGGGTSTTGEGTGGGGGNSGTTTGNYTVTVTGTSGTVSTTVGTVALTVQ